MGKRNDAKWLRYFELCKKYVAEHDGFAPSQRAEMDGVLIGRWYHAQVGAFSNGVMPEDRQDAWLAFVSSVKHLPAGVRRDDARWGEQFSVFKAYVRENCRFPTMNAVYDGVRVGDWYHNQCTALREGLMPEERMVMMDVFHPAWRGSYEEKREAEKEMLLQTDWKSNVPEGDVSLDVALGNQIVGECLLQKLYGCQQYLNAYYQVHGCNFRAFVDAHEGVRVVKQFGEGLFSFENRKAVFETLYPRVSFVGYQLACAMNGYSDDGMYFQRAEAFNQGSRFDTAAEMDEAIFELLDGFHSEVGDVLYCRFYKGLTLQQTGDEIARCAEGVRQLEKRGLMHLKQFSTIFSIDGRYGDLESRLERAQEAAEQCVGAERARGELQL